MPRILGRTRNQRTALLRNLGRSLVIAETLTTTLPKAKEVKHLIDRWVAQAKRAARTEKQRSLAEYRKLIVLVNDQSVAQKLVTEIAPRTGSRTSGFTRLWRVTSRLGDAAQRGRLTFTDQAPVPKKKDAKAATLTGAKAPKVTIKPAQATKA